MNFRPLRSLVAIRRDEAVTQIGSVLLAREKIADRGIVVAVGPKVTSVVPGERVLLKQWKPNGPTIDGDLLMIAEDKDLMAVIE